MPIPGIHLQFWPQNSVWNSLRNKQKHSGSLILANLKYTQHSSVSYFSNSKPPIETKNESMKLPRCILSICETHWCHPCQVANHLVMSHTAGNRISWPSKAAALLLLSSEEDDRMIEKTFPSSLKCNANTVERAPFTLYLSLIIGGFSNSSRSRKWTAQQKLPRPEPEKKIWDDLVQQHGGVTGILQRTSLGVLWVVPIQHCFRLCTLVCWWVPHDGPVLMYIVDHKTTCFCFISLP